ncbi:23072_t:CDS:1, partial [Gigaspora margarita]
YEVDINLDLHAASCKIWAENSAHYRIGGDGSNDYYDCSSGNDPEKFSFQDQTFWVHAKVEASTRHEKIRGPYNNKTCFRIHGYLDRWYFDEESC